MPARQVIVRADIEDWSHYRRGAFAALNDSTRYFAKALRQIGNRLARTYRLVKVIATLTAEPGPIRPGRLQTGQFKAHSETPGEACRM